MSLPEVGGLLIAASFATVQTVRAARLRRRHRRLQHEVLALRRLAEVDSLTGMATRGHIDRLLHDAHADAVRSRRELTVLLVDLDHFKRVNDTFGHLAGDHVLRVIAARLQDAVRAGDQLGRWGGEEFLVLLPDTGHDEACRVADRICRTAGASPISVGTGGDLIEVTVSVGGHTSIDTDPLVRVHAADRGLYRAKRGGRNRAAVNIAS